MNYAARRSYLKATECARQARQFKLAGCTKMASGSADDARWHKARAVSLAKNCEN